MLAARIALAVIFASIAFTVLLTAVTTGSPLVWLAVVCCLAGAWTGQRAARAFFTDVPHQDRAGTIANSKTVLVWSLSTLLMLAATFGLLALGGPR